MKHPNQKHKPFRVRAPWQDNVLSLAAILSLLLITLLAVFFVLRLLFSSGLFSRDILTQPPPDTAVDTDAPSVYDKLLPDTASSDDTADGNVIAFSGDFSVLRALLSDGETADNYVAEYETVLYTGNTEAKTAVRIYRLGACYRIERNPGAFSASVPAEVYVCDGTTVAFTDAQTGDTRFFPVSDAFDMASLAGIPSLVSFTETDDAQTESITYTALDGTVTYHVIFRIPTESGSTIREEYWISPTEELVLRCQTYDAVAKENEDAARLLYSFSRKSTRPLTEREAERIFRLPTEKTP